MRARRRVMVAAVAVALVVAGAAGAERMGMLTIGVGGGSHATATGIQVHGRWNLVVRAKNGKVVARRRFENSLTSDGAGNLIALITGGAGGLLGAGDSGNNAGYADETGGIAVWLDDGSGNYQGCNRGGFNSCFLDAVLSGCSLCSPQNVYQGGLHVSASGSTLTLTGQAVLLGDTTIQRVETQLKMCASGNENSQDCGQDTGSDPKWLPFTSKTLSPALNVTAGQTVGVTVKISFS